MEALKFNLLNPPVVKYWYFFAMSLGTWVHWQQPRDLPRARESPPPQHSGLWLSVCGHEELKSTAKNENVDDGATIQYRTGDSSPHLE